MCTYLALCLYTFPIKIALMELEHYLVTLVITIPRFCIPHHYTFSISLCVTQSPWSLAVLFL